MKLSWRDVFNTNHKWWGTVDAAAAGARQAGYRLMAFNGRVYETTVELKGRGSLRELGLDEYEEQKTENPL